jgi:very-short-patch-repair endonuclease
VNIDLEIDGKQHEIRKEHDEKRDFYVSKQYKVYRIKWKSINNESGKKYMKNEIGKFLEFYNSLK